MFWRRRKRSLADLKAEIDSHLAHEADQVRDAGGSPDPQGAARRAFGNVTAVEEAHYEHHHWMFFDHLTRDFRQAFRQATARPGFSAIVILTLAFGIGANSSIFGVIQAVLLRPLPYKDPSRLAMLFGDDPARELHEGRVSLANFSDWKAQSHSFDDMTVFIGQTFLLGTDGARTDAIGARASELLDPPWRHAGTGSRLYVRRRDP
jgi:macrolide transport system ATP-binding/permease protein